MEMGYSSSPHWALEVFWSGQSQRGVSNCSPDKGSLTVEGEHREESFHIRFGLGPMDLIILAPRLAPGSSKSHPCSLSRIGVGKT